MGTRGKYGFVYKGKRYMMYQHCGASPAELGTRLLREIRKAIKNGTFDQWKEMLEKIKVVDEKIPPTAEDIEKCSGFYNSMVSGKSRVTGTVFSETLRAVSCAFWSLVICFLLTRRVSIGFLFLILISSHSKFLRKNLILSPKFTSFLHFL